MAASVASRDSVVGQRRRLAVKGKVLGRKRLAEVGALFSPDTILRWHRKLVADHHTYDRKSPGRPPLDERTIALIVRLAMENATWGCDRIVGELRKLGCDISDTTVERILLTLPDSMCSKNPGLRKH